MPRIKREDLEKIDFISDNGYEYYDGVFDFMFDVKEQCLYSHCEVDGKLEKIGVVKSIGELLALKDLWIYPFTKNDEF